MVKVNYTMEVGHVLADKGEEMKKCDTNLLPSSLKHHSKGPMTKEVFRVVFKVSDGLHFLRLKRGLNAKTVPYFASQLM